MRGALVDKSFALAAALFPKAHSVFIRLFSNLSPGSVKAKIAGELKNRTDKGRFICYFEVPGTLYSWTYDELRGIMSTSGVFPKK